MRELYGGRFSHLRIVNICIDCIYPSLEISRTIKGKYHQYRGWHASKFNQLNTNRSNQVKNQLDRTLLSVLLDVAVGDLGKRPHMTASAEALYLWRTLEFETLSGPKKLTLDIRTYDRKPRHLLVQVKSIIHFHCIPLG